MVDRDICICGGCVGVFGFTGKRNWNYSISKKLNEAKMRKGEMVVSPIMIAIIAVFVLIISIIGVSMFGDKISGFFKVIPSFNESLSGEKSSEVFRYVIPGERIDYYDGVSWKEFDGEVDVNGRILVKEEILNSFRGYYYRSNSQVDTMSVLKQMKSSEVVYVFDGEKSGEVVIFIKNTNKRLILENNDVLSVEDGAGKRIDYFGADRKEIKEKAIIWRDSIFSKPMKFEYSLADGEKLIGETCVEKKVTSVNGKFERYLIADFNKAGENCGNEK